MKLKLQWLYAATLTIFSGTAISQATLHVSATGTDVSNDCTLPGNPCATIGHAYTQITAGDTIKVAPGSYNLNATLNISESVVITSSDPSDQPVITSSVADLINVNSDDVTISNLNFQMGLTATSGLRGIVSTQNFDNIKILNNTFESTNPISGTPNTNMVWTAFAISLASDNGHVQNVEIRNNEIIAASTANIFGRGIFIGNGGAGKDAPGGIIDGNNVTAYYAIQSARFANDMDITNNTFNGITMINAPLTGVTVAIDNNTFSGETQMTPNSLYALVELRSVEDASVIFSNNTVENYTNIGFISESSKNVTVSGNTFNPAATAANFISLMVNTKFMTNGVQGNTYSDEIEILGNTFNAGTVNQGTAIVFADHYGVNTPAFGTITIGGATAADQNIFDADLGKYIVLDDNAGASTAYPLWAPYHSTTMKPVDQNITALAIHNNYNLVDFAAIEAKITDADNNPLLGQVIIKSAGPNRYVATTGTDVSNDCTLPGNPCATIAHAVEVAVDSDTINVAAGTYAQTAILTIDVNDLTVRAGDANDKPVITTNQSTVFDINATDVKLNGLRLELGLTAATGKYGVVSTTSNFNGLALTNNEIVSTSPVIPYGMVWDAFAVRLNSLAGAMDNVTITDNVIGTATASDNNIFGRGVALGSGSTDGPAANISNNEIKAYYTVQAIRSTADVTITNNDIQGITMINAPLTGVEVVVENNTIDAVTPMAADNLYALVEIRSVENATVEINGNDFTNYTNIALLSSASKNVTVSGNIFTPASTADAFVSVMANTKMMTNGVQGDTYGNEIVLIGNEFEAGAANEGTAIVFADHYGATTPAFAAVTIGGTAAADKNIFDANLGNYIVLDDKTGASSSVPLWAPYSVTTMKPFSQSIEALYDNNTYNQATIADVELKNTDSLDNDELGKVILTYSTVGLDEVAISAATLYPNPTADQLTISLNDNSATAALEVVDLLGNVVYTTTVSGVKTINVSNLNAGVYVTRLTTNGVTASTRFVKQ